MTFLLIYEECAINSHCDVLLYVLTSNSTNCKSQNNKIAWLVTNFLAP